jgi:predicted transport protein
MIRMYIKTYDSNITYKPCQTSIFRLSENFICAKIKNKEKRDNDLAVMSLFSSYNLTQIV